jgi:inosine-uridine nucleoside N-ribohydrolase
VTLFHQIEKEMAWRKSIGKPEGFDMLKVLKPLGILSPAPHSTLYAYLLILYVVAVGANEPLADQLVMADYFHGLDGLGGIHVTHPHFSPTDTWRNLFKSALNSKEPEEVKTAREIEKTHHTLFTPVQESAPDAILRMLRENEKDEITIVAIGPLTNLAIAAAKDPETFLKAKDVIVMGGALEYPGNVGHSFSLMIWSYIIVVLNSLEAALNLC